ncbi:MAG: 2,3-bisphosphoglycerate-independent phosphoglycerate mutase [Chloroflexaceae bacterium]|nr:2,3-bisphosphoglycerate-independent phosphoglycerate mutase [Chloroflexaceae bacterium]
MSTTQRPRPVVLAIMDGWGLAEPGPGNGVTLANTPNVDAWSAVYPYTTLAASGMDVGLPEGQIGNSEVGHLNIGAGMIVYQDYTRINKSIQDGDFFTNAAFQGAINHVKQHGSKLHVIGLFGPGGVHSHQDHLHALLELAQREGLDALYLHLLLDGRDVLPRSALGFLDKLEAAIQRIGMGTIATVGGRYYGMDRDKRWERTGRHYDTITTGQGPTNESPRAAIEASYANDVSDEFMIPVVIVHDGAPVATVNDHDAIIYYNFRPDRGRQMTQAFVFPDINERIQKHYQQQQAEGQSLPDHIWQRGPQMNDLFYVTMTRYEEGLPVHIAYPPNNVEHPMAQVVSAAGLHQFHIAETEKYPHVTFFFNGRREQPFDGEDRVLVASPKVATYDLQPEMSAAGVTEALLKAINSDQYDFIIVNYANPDMVGHTGIPAAIITACETVDASLGQVVPVILEKGGAVLIIADHGNAEMMVDTETGGPHTAHTTNLVPCILAAPPDMGLSKDAITLRSGGRLADVVPTLLDLMGLQPAAEMTGETLIVRA